MANEGEFPKANGDVQYASEVNAVAMSLFGKTIFGDGSDGALSVGSGTTTISTPIKQYSSISVEDGATLTFSGLNKCRIMCQGDCTINGALTLITGGTSTPPTAFDNITPAAPTNITGGSGGTSVTAHIIYYNPSLFKQGSSSLISAAGSGSASGAAGGAGGASGMWLELLVGGTLTIGATAAISGSGGAGSAGVNNANGGGGGGAGGAASSLFIVARKTVDLASGASITLNGGNGGNGGVATNYSSDGGGGGGATAGYSSSGASGGNGGTGAAKGNGGGGAGGTGGTLLILGLGSLSNNATISVAGGAGGNKGGSSAQDGNVGTTGTSRVISASITLT